MSDPLKHTEAYVSVEDSGCLQSPLRLPPWHGNESALPASLSVSSAVRIPHVEREAWCPSKEFGAKNDKLVQREHPLILRS